MKFTQAFKKISDKDFLDKLGRDNILEMSASLSFYSAMSLAPLLVLLLTFISLINDDFREQLISQVQTLVGPEAGKLIRDIARNVNQRPDVRDWAGLLGLLTLLFSAGAIFGSLRSSLSRIFEVEGGDLESPEGSVFQSTWSFVKQKILNMGMVLTFVFISIISLVVSSGLSWFLKGAEAVIGQLLNFVVSLVIFGILFSAIYAFLPKKKVPRRVAITSGFLTAILFSLGKSLIGFYLGQSAASSLYGAAGSFVVLLLWVYYSSAVIFISAEIAHEINSGEVLT